MKHELHHIEGDREALTWAIGCVLASYIERSKLMDVLDTLYARMCVTFLIAGEVLNYLFATALTAASCLHELNIAEFLGGFTPGDDYRRFIPIMNATPLWLHGLWITASVLFAISAWQLLRNSRAAFAFFASAWVVGAAGDLIGRMIVPQSAYRETFSFSAPLFIRDYLIPAVTALIPVLIAGALWAHRRCILANGESVG